MQLNDLRAFVLTAEFGSVTRAATRVNRVQSAVSQAIGRLQKEFGVVLLTRTAEGMQPTAAGLELAREGKTILERVERVERDMGRFRRDGAPTDFRVTGTVELGIVPSLTPVLLSRLLRAIRHRADGLMVHVREGLNGEIALQVAEHRLDIGILWLPVEGEGLHSQPLGASGLVAVVPPDHPTGTSAAIPVGRLAGETWIAFPHGNPMRHWVEQSCREAGFSPQIRFEVQTLQEAKAFVEAGAGVTLLPPASVRLEVACGAIRAVPLGGPAFHATFGYVCAPERASEPALATRDIIDSGFATERRATTLEKGVESPR